MSNFPPLPKNFFIIDATNRDEYCCLSSDDVCLYLWERMSQVKSNFCKYPANSFISNFQILPSCKTDQPYRYKHKESAIKFAATALGKLLPGAWCANGTFIPVPPSKITSDPEYDNRLLKTLNDVQPLLSDVRELVLQRESVDAKIKGKRPEDRSDNYYIDERLSEPEPSNVFIFDDVLTTGSHYKAMQMILHRRFPEATIAGVFLTRAVRPDGSPP